MWESISNFFTSIYEDVAFGLSSLFESIPVPEFLVNQDVIVIPGSISFFLEPMRFSFGLTVIASAYTLRFLIRRIPFIG